MQFTRDSCHSCELNKFEYKPTSRGADASWIFGSQTYWHSGVAIDYKKWGVTANFADGLITSICIKLHGGPGVQDTPINVIVRRGDRLFLSGPRIR